MKRKILKNIAMGVVFLGLLTLYFFYESRTQKFRFQEILSQLAPSSTEPVVAEGVNERLQQKFFYLGSGKQCHAFLGEDQKTVLKFFRHGDPSFERLLNKCSIPLEAWYGKFFIHYNPKLVIESYQLAYEILPELTGVLYLHLNRTSGQHGKVRLVDSSWVEHEVNLDETEFLLQNYGELAIVRIDRQMKEEDLAGAIKSIAALFEAVEERILKGVQMQDSAFRRNVGFYGERVMLLDAGSLKKSYDLQTPREVYQEIELLTTGLRRWIHRHHPTLDPYFQDMLIEKRPL